MIEFFCDICGIRHKVDDVKAGQRGKCPNCNAVITVPEASQSGIIFDEEELICKDSDLQQVYDFIVKSYGDRIVRHTIFPNDILLFELPVDKLAKRTQSVYLAKFYIEMLLANKFAIYSEVGEITMDEAAVFAIRLANQSPFGQIVLDDNNIMGVRMLIDIEKDLQEIFTCMLEIAVLADKLEEQIFNWDKK
ncbi:MAG: hypothetical protein ACQESN_08180 [Thermotogota bacterium]